MGYNSWDTPDARVICAELDLPSGGIYLLLILFISIQLILSIS